MRERESERGEVCRMNRGVFQSSTVQQIMGGSPSWWNLNNLRPASQQTSPFLPSPSSSVFPQYPQASNSLPLSTRQDNQDLPESWSQLLLGGLVGEEDKCSFTPSQPKRMENWEGQVTYPSASSDIVDHIKQEISESGHGCGHVYDEIQGARSSWSHILSASSPRSCVTSFSSNMLDFSNNNGGRQPQPNLLSARNSALTGSTFKKARVQETISSAHSTFKVRKEKLGDRITALHQLVSPFGKTDTASVLLEAIGYIRFLHGQIEALSSPYLGGGSGNLRHSDGDDEPKKDLRSRGLCLVPVSCNLHVGSDNGADYWAPALGGGF